MILTALLLCLFAELGLANRKCEKMLGGLEETSLDEAIHDGFGVFRHKPILTLKQREQVREELDDFKGHHALYFNVLTNFGNFSQTVEADFGVQIGKRVEHFLTEIKDALEEQGRTPFEFDLVMRNEKSGTDGTGLQVTNGHRHLARTMTITKAEIGASSWVMINGKKLELPMKNSDKALLFTQQLHGTPSKLGKKRLLFIVNIRFFPMNLIPFHSLSRWNQGEGKRITY